MRLPVTIHDLVSLKGDLKAAYPNVKPTSLVEGAARGLGYNTYASLRAALAGSPLDVEANDHLFSDYIDQPPEKGKAPRGLSRALARITVRKVLEAYPDLTQRGFDDIWARESEGDSFEERKALFAERRKEALSNWAMDEFELAFIYLSKQEHRKTLNRDWSTYNLKHNAERLVREDKLFDHLGDYVSNGMLIVAAIASGFEVKQISFRSPNGFLNISSKTIRQTSSTHLMTRPQRAALTDFLLQSA
jgi:hypothetical protein